jgi:nitrite reductase/ring-hydroxylating ferredoxin subunit/uncharacterized membrane protein
MTTVAGKDAPRADLGSEPLAREAAAEKIERFDALDAFAEFGQTAVRRAVPQGSRVKDILSGTWLGHPLHPPLTDAVIGSWLSGGLLDLLGGKEAERAADRLIGIGCLAALPTALAGLSDWAELRGGPRRVGVVHAAGNTTALALYSLSWWLRRRGRRRTGIALSSSGAAISMFSAWLGGHLSFRRGVGVNQTAFEQPPEEWTPVHDADALDDGRLVRADAGGIGIVLVRRGERVHALIDRCSHRGCSLSEGSFENDLVTCPCHGSRFRLDGSVARGPATSPQPVLAARLHNGRVEVRAAENE